MNFQFTHPLWLLAFVPAAAWTLWLAVRSDASLSPWRRRVSTGLRLLLLALLAMGIAGLQWKRPQEGMNVFFLLDRSDSVPSGHQERARELANKWAGDKKKEDKAGYLVFGSDAALETTVTDIAKAERIEAIVGGERTDIAGAIRLGTAAFPENGQKRLVLMSDGNENIGDATAAALAARPLGVTIDVLPLGAERGGDVSVQRLVIPSNLKKGQTFDAKIFAMSDKVQAGTVRLFRNDQLLGEQKVRLDAGRNLFSFPQTLGEPGFYGYQVQIEVPGDAVAQNNKAAGFANVRGDPRVLLVSADPKQDEPLAAALRSAKLEVKVGEVGAMPATLAEMQSYDAVFLSNISAGDLGPDLMRLLESAVRDFGVGLVCVGGDNSFAAGGYRNTPLEAALPLDMELSSKKVLPSGALVLVMHGMEFGNGNQVSRDIGIAALDSLGPQDEMGVLLWDGTEHWLFELQKVGDKKALARTIAGMNQGDLPSFQGLMQMGHDSLAKSHANLKHMIVFSDGDPGAPSDKLMKDLVAAKVTVSTVMIGGHVQPTTMEMIAGKGGGRFYDVKSPAQLPQIFIKEAAVILKSAIFEEPFKPQVASPSELIRGIGSGEFPTLRGYVSASPKPRAEIPLLSEKGDPILAHWQYGLGRTVAFTSDAKSKWAQDWLGWSKYRQFWTQVAKWALRRIDASEFNTEVAVENGQGRVNVEALDREGNFRNFLRLRTSVVSPRGVRQDVVLEQTGPGHYEARFDTKEVGAYLMNLQDLDDQGLVRGSQVLGASVNYSPEFDASEPNLPLLRRLAELGGGKVLDPATENPFRLGRQKTFQPRDLWEWLLRILVCLFVLDVGVRRVDFDREEWGRWLDSVKRRLGFGDARKAVETEESMAALLARKKEVRAQQASGGDPRAVVVLPPKPSADLFRPKQSPVPSQSDAEGQGGTGGTVSTPRSGGGTAAPTGSPAERLLEAKRRAQRKK
ncbi:MAG: VWA domain-containing protein [Verrucomicrobia bacterium]|nr:MAG: VWA domain-containing protein [Verrucomicrobiota bacterium]